ncbi:hypothetical protein HYX07_04185 [Candidatus Woesearchaeota archaeon]|nr:hypothetical protein [Candidatus Woesearchaeota archaeon]
MPKINLKIFDYETLAKDYGVSFMAGLMGGFTVLFFSNVINAVLEMQWLKALVGFTIYIAIAIFVFFAGFWWVKKVFLKNTKKDRTKDGKNFKPFKFLFNFFHDYFWAIGISLMIVGATKIWENSWGILISGFIFLTIGSVFRALKD